jgi:hypothetical protein
MTSSTFVPQVQNDPIYSLPHLYISGLNISIASTTILAIAPGQARDMNDNIDMPVGFPNLQGITTPAVQFSNYMPPILINSAVNGANGLDFGTIVANTSYGVWLIADSRGYKPVAGLLSSTVNVYPKLPFGYDSMRLIGFIQVDGSSHFVYATHKPQNMVGALSYFNQPPITVLSGGNATTFTIVMLNTGGAVPTTTLNNVICQLLITFIPAAAGDFCQFRASGSPIPNGNYLTIVGNQAGIAQTQYVQVIASNNGTSQSEIDYLVSNSSDSLTIAVAGWTGVSNTAYPVTV